MECSNLVSCSKCKTGFQLVQSNTLCSVICNDQQCSICSDGNAGSCTVCNAGYAIDTNTPGTCVKVVCSVEFCNNCASLTECSSCQPFYDLQNNVCTPKCTTDVPNCVLCASDTTCSSCAVGYTLASSTSCTSICTIANCMTCATASTCGTCKAGY